ncbi:MAG TPA: sigma-70 family RNA polymerase sigma factor [Candidatus Rikenella faecigallinarum]|uniref:Sigma-70 family RNA polymerase sigma factor n=1 Tax=Candidatus Rikenella faecigallinarum TaxID=2838745 RepID=A0A9D1QBP3_9BACT|nr:sigma-70 family RNA polymerase sigma factor [Candidatus Rikenella faecigallinarum]
MDITPQKLTDQELVEQTLAGNTICYETLFDRYRHPLYAAIVSRCGDEQDAGDIIQETYVKAYFNLPRYNADYTFGQWVYTIARNLFIDYARRKRSAGSTVSIDSNTTGEMINPACDMPNPEERIISRQRSSLLDNLLEELPAHYRTMIQLRFIKEYSYEEIAEQLGMPIGTVKTQIHRARERLCRLITARQLL